MSVIEDDLGISVIAVFPAALHNDAVYSAGPIWWPERVVRKDEGPINKLYGYESKFISDPSMSELFSRVMAFSDSDIGLIAHGPLHRKTRYRKDIFIKMDDDKHVWYVRQHKGKIYYTYDMWSDIKANSPSIMWKIHKRIRMSKMRPDLIKKARNIFKAWISGEEFNA
jgi:hypothetical protein